MRIVSICKLRQFLSVFFIFVLLTPTSFAKEFNWNDWQSILQQHLKQSTIFGISSATIHYQALVGDPRIKNTLSALKVYDPKNLDKNEKLAFYINAYNFLAVSIVVDNLPLQSIKDIGSIFSQVWGKNVGEINGKKISLNHIEHNVLRTMMEPRIHFAIVCASASCPDLSKEIYYASKIEQQLETQTMDFIHNITKGTFSDENNNTLHISSIFKWYIEDFKRQGGVIAFIKKYKTIQTSGIDIEYKDYNWKLNAHTQTK